MEDNLRTVAALDWTTNLDQLIVTSLKRMRSTEILQHQADLELLEMLR